MLVYSTPSVSPACVEGTTRHVAMAWLQSGTTQIHLTPGIDNRRFAKVSLPTYCTNLNDVIRAIQARSNPDQ